MNTVRLIARYLFVLSRLAAILIFLVWLYATVVLLFSFAVGPSALPLRILENRTFQILLPFTNQPFLLGDYSAAYIVPNLLIIAFYSVFLWLLSGVFYAFKQVKLFTIKGVRQLSTFYLTNLIVPFLFLLLSLVGQELSDMIRIILLHLVIGVFAYFMASIFKQGLLLQEEQDLTF